MTGTIYKMLIWEYYTRYAECIYKINTGSTSEVIFYSTSGKISQLNAYQNDQNHQPTLSNKYHSLVTIKF